MIRRGEKVRWKGGNARDRWWKVKGRWRNKEELGWTGEELRMKVDEHRKEEEE